MSTNTYATVPPMMVALEVLKSVRTQFPNILNYASDFTSKGLRKGQAFTAEIPEVPEVKEFDPNVGYRSSDNNFTGVNMVIEKHKFVALDYKHNEQMTRRKGKNPLAEQIDNSAYALGRDLTEYVTGLITPTAFPSVVTEAEENVDAVTMRKLRRTLRKKGIPMKNVMGILNGETFDFLAEDPKVISKDLRMGTGVNDAEGIITNLRGFDHITEYDGLQDTDNLIGWVGQRQAIALATGVPDDPAEYFPELKNNGGVIKTVKDPVTGLAIMMRFYYDWNLGHVNMAMTWLYGAKVWRPEFGVRLVKP